MYSKLALPASATLTSRVPANPRKPGTRGHVSFAIVLATPGITYLAYLAAGGRQIDLTWDHARGWVSVSGNADAKVQVAPLGKLARDGNPVAKKAAPLPTLEVALAVVRDAAHAEALIEDAARLAASAEALAAKVDKRLAKKA